MTIQYDILPVILLLLLISSRQHRKHIISIIQPHQPIFQINKNRQSHPIEKIPFLIHKSLVYQMQPLQVYQGGEEGYDPWQADGVEIN